MAILNELVSMIHEGRRRAPGEDWRRDHWGASGMAKECDRAIWFSGRWAMKPRFLLPKDLPKSVNDSGGRMLRLFDRGRIEEPIVVGDLERLGFTVWAAKEDASQFKISAFANHFGGSCDGFARDNLGLIGPKGRIYLLEIKTFNKSTWASLHKHGLRNHARGPAHIGQMDLYCGGFKVDHWLYAGICKDDDSLHYETEPADPKNFARLLRRAEELIFSDDAPERISSNPSNFVCRFCDFWDICHQPNPDRWKTKAEGNCRTCVYSAPLPYLSDATPRPNKPTWTCSVDTPNLVELSPDAQRAGCEHHNLLPILQGDS